MDVIFAKIILNEEGKTITKKDLINERFDCEIFVNEVRFINNIKLKKDNHIIYNFKKKYTDMKSMFYNCSLLISINLSNFNTNNVTNMGSMFYNCSLLTSINLSNFNTNNVTNMGAMFYNCSLLTSINLSNFNTNNVTDMAYMFYNCLLLTSINLSNFNTNNVTDMACMFYNCPSLTSINLSNFNCDKIKETTEMEDMFRGCNRLKIENVKYKDFKIRNQLIVDLKL